jgi:hypothetical protein
MYLLRTKPKSGKESEAKTLQMKPAIANDVGL